MEPREEKAWMANFPNCRASLESEDSKDEPKGDARSKPYEFETDTTLPSQFCALSNAGIASLQTEESLKDVILPCRLCKTSLKEYARLNRKS